MRVRTVTRDVTIEVLDRFMRFVSPEPNTGCWLWTGTTSRGYGSFAYGRRGNMVTASRFSYAAHVGPIPAGLHVCHRCDQPACVNPAHLFCGTRSDNMRDCSAKGRQAVQRDPSLLRGERNPNAKLSLAQVQVIRERYAAGGASCRALASEHGVSIATIRFLLTGRTWRTAA